MYRVSEKARRRIKINNWCSQFSNKEQTFDTCSTGVTRVSARFDARIVQSPLASANERERTLTVAFIIDFVGSNSVKSDKYSAVFVLNDVAETIVRKTVHVATG